MNIFLVHSKHKVGDLRFIDKYKDTIVFVVN